MLVLVRHRGTALFVLLQACGSGATLGGLALGNALSGYGSEVIGYGVCDDEDYFYDFIDELYTGLGSTLNASDILTMVQARGAGYAISRCASSCMLSAHTAARAFVCHR
jgi:1-aminocyclopropane-1-carboxylate deaminase/D-cysteine desulfhydrase-like pyridoxal-dependent ACC family enzyme